MKGSGKTRGTVGEPVYSQPRFKIIADAMNQVPIASGAMGAVAGFPAGRLVASHFSVMTGIRQRCSSAARRWWSVRWVCA